MCGILAEWRRARGGSDMACSHRRLDLMRHRGPDGYGLIGWSAELGFSDTHPDPEVVLGHRRLAIIDLSPGGAQPMLSPDGRYAITYNGEIYNYVELREELGARHGWRFRSDSDTEVLLAAWATWGEAALDRLDGMYGFVVLDTVERRLTAARDPFAMKPLHYAAGAGGMMFASEARPLIAHGSTQANVSRLFEFLRWGASDEGGQTLFRGVRQLEPGHLLTLDLDTGQAATRRFWRPPTRPSEGGSPEDWRRRFRELFVASIERHLRADVPVVATLSGGLDSSAICSAIRSLRPGQPVQVFSYIASGKDSEERWIDAVAADKQLQVEKVHLHEDQMLEDLPALIRAQEQPFGSGSIYAQYKIFEAIAGQGHKVMLDGQGADEILGGYKSLVAYRISQLLAEGRLNKAAGLFGAHARRDPGSMAVVLQRLVRMALPARPAAAARRLAGRSLEIPFLDDDWLAVQQIDVSVAESRQFHTGRGFDEVLQRNLESGVLPSLLRYADRNAMAFSVENRTPFLSRPLVEMVFSLPPEALISSDGRTKAVLRDALDGILPPAIQNRHDKVGFRATEEAWMMSRADWTRRELAECAELPFVNRPALQRAAASFFAGQSRDGVKLFRLIVYNRWLRTFGVSLP